MAAPRFRSQVIMGRLVSWAPETVADLGCGTGMMLREVGETLSWARRIGIDLSPSQIDLARRDDPDAEWYVVDLDDAHATVPGGVEGRCEAVIAAELVEHLDHPERFLKSARRLCAADGRLIVSTQSGPMRETERRVGHVRHYSIDEMTDLLSRSGWRPIRVWNAGWPFHDLSKWWANRDSEASMERFGEQAYGASERAICWVLRQLFRLNSNRRGAQLFAIATPEKSS